MEIYLLRHGRSMANTAKLVTGSKADTLCPEGRAQAQAAATLLKRFALDGPNVCRFVSDWSRAKETAALAAPHQNFVVDARLGETNAGSTAEMTLAAFNLAHPTFWSSFDPERAYPEGESHADLYTRVLAWLEEMGKTSFPSKKILAVTHAGPICCLLHAVCKVDMAHFPTFLAANASLTKIEKTTSAPWRLSFFSHEAEKTT